MKKIYSILLTAILLFTGYSCDDGSLDHSDVFIPDPVEEGENGNGGGDTGIAPEPTTRVAIKVNPSVTHQVIDGFGCAFAEWSHNIYASMEREKIVEELFDPKTGLGLNIFRGEVFPHYENPSTGQIDFGMDRNFRIAANDPNICNGFYEKFNGHDSGKQVQMGQMWLVDYISRKYEDVNFVISAWSPPASMIKAASGTIGGALSPTAIKPEKKEAFATYLKDFILAYQKKFKLKIYGLSPANEPNARAMSWAYCNWENTDLPGFCVNTLLPTLDANGLQDLKLIYGEWAQWKGGADFVEKGLKAQPSLANPTRVIAAGHGYPPVTSSTLSFIPYSYALDKGLHVWNTETSNTQDYDPSWNDAMGWATQFHNYLTEGSISAFIWWAGARITDNNESLIRFIPRYDSNGSLTFPLMKHEIPLRYYSYGQFTKYIPKGSQRVDVAKYVPEGEEDPFPQDLLMSAYVTDNTYTIVLVNKSQTQSFQTLIEIDGKEFQSMSTYYSDANVKWKRTNINPSESGLRAIKVPKYSVITITGTMKDKTVDVPDTGGEGENENGNDNE